MSYVEKLKERYQDKQDNEGLLNAKGFVVSGDSDKEDIAKAILDMIEADEVADKDIF